MNTKKGLQLFFSFILVLAAQSILAQSIDIKGLVVDNLQQPIPGANVVEKGTTNGVATDFDGNFSISVAGPKAVLVFSYIGFATKEVTVADSRFLTVTLEEGAATLDEVVLVGYGTQKRRDLTGATVSADIQSIAEVPSPNILESLNGSLPGVTIGVEAAAGEEPNIQVRGQSTINGNASPLYVLDGVPYRGRIVDIHPSDIKSIDVLKDASSKAIYGAQAANGIILISTKRGSGTQEATVSYSTKYSVQGPANELTPLGREGYLRKARDLDYENGYLGPDFLTPNPDWTPALSGNFNPPVQDGIDNGTDFNWYDEVTNPGFITDHNLSVQGRDEKTNYYISGSFTDQKNWMLNDNFRRTTARINLDTKVNDWLSVGVSSFASFADLSGESPSLDGLVRMSPVAPPFDADGNIILAPLGNNQPSPLLVSDTDDSNKRNSLFALVYASIDMPGIKGLNYRANFSNNYRWSQEANASVYAAGFTGRAFKNNFEIYDYTFDNILNYKYRSNNDDHGIDATFVAGINKISEQSTFAEGTNFTSLDLSFNSLQQAVVQQISSSAEERSFSYQMGRLNYDYKQRYLITATLRRDGFSGFATGNKTAMFPSLALGWTLSNEGFMEDSKTFDFLKLRASYGENGNLTNPYSSLSRVVVPIGGDDDLGDSRYVFGDGGSTVNGQTITSLSNPNLTWETTRGINVGLDFSLLKNKIRGNIDYYASNTKDLLWDFILPRISGFESIISNVGEIQNSGLEIFLNTTPVRTQNFKWDFGLNFDTNRNEIVSLIGLDSDGDGQEDDLIANGLFIGEPINTIYDYQIDGLYQIGDEDIREGWAPGFHRLADLNGDGEITPEGDRRILGNEDPAFNFGIRNTLTYKDFSLTFFINSRQGGNDGYRGLNNPWDGNTSSLGLAQNNNWYSEIDYWSPSNPNATFRRTGANAPINSLQYFDRSFVRLQNLSMTYNLNQKVADDLGIKGLTISIGGQNLITWTDWKGWDPENGQGLGASENGLPLMRRYTLGLNISL